jgi:hypothetical protein
LIAAADASIERLPAGHDPARRLLADSTRSVKGVAKCLELSRQRSRVAAMICVFDRLGRDQQIVRRAAVCAF